MTKHYLIRIFGDVEPMVVGQYKSDEERIGIASDIRKETKEDGVYRLDIVNGKPKVNSFRADEIDPLFTKGD